MYECVLFRSWRGKYFSELKCVKLLNVHSESVCAGRRSEVVLKYLLIVPEVSVTFFFVFVCVTSAGSLQHLALFFASQLITGDTGSSSSQT